MDRHKDFTLIKQGAEARLYKGIYLGKSTLLKERFTKTYRHPALDESLTKERMKAETRAIVRCKAAGIHTPVLYLVDMERRRIYMEYIENSVTVKDHINKVSNDTTLGDVALDPIARNIGETLGRMHAHNIVHGDLTTSNMLLVQKGESEPLTLVLIDFGLSHVETSAEDKGVDLYVLERALLSTHASAEHIFPLILEAYAKGNAKGCKEVLRKFEDVRARGRKRTMIG